MLTRVSPSGQYLAVLEDLNPERTAAALKLYRADRTLIAEVAPEVMMNGELRHGTWSWFEASRSTNPHAVGVIFTYTWYDSTGQPHSPDGQVDIDASTGQILESYRAH